MTAKTATKNTPKATANKPAKAKAKKLSALDAAAQVLAGNGGAMNTKEMIEAMAAQKLWESPNGKTPAATLYAAILREVTTKGTGSRFQKTEPGQFAATAVARTTATADEPKPAPKTAKPKAAMKKQAGKRAAKPKAEPTAAPAIPDGTDGPESMKELFRL